MDPVEAWRREAEATQNAANDDYPLDPGSRQLLEAGDALCAEVERLRHAYASDTGELLNQRDVARRVAWNLRFAWRKGEALTVIGDAFPWEK